jgi:hypothetical protein
MLVSRVGKLGESEKTLTFSVTSQNWKPLNESARASAEYSVNEVQTEALRQLVPDSGAYINEVLLSGHILTWSKH